MPFVNATALATDALAFRLVGLTFAGTPIADAVDVVVVATGVVDCLLEFNLIGNIISIITYAGTHTHTHTLRVPNNELFKRNLPRLNEGRPKLLLRLNRTFKRVIL